MAGDEDASDDDDDREHGAEKGTHGGEGGLRAGRVGRAGWGRLLTRDRVEVAAEGEVEVDPVLESAGGHLEQRGAELEGAALRVENREDLDEAVLVAGDGEFGGAVGLVGGDAELLFLGEVEGLRGERDLDLGKGLERGLGVAGGDFFGSCLRLVDGGPEAASLEELLGQ